jgi:hypothetical protein
MSFSYKVFYSCRSPCCLYLLAATKKEKEKDCGFLKQKTTTTEKNPLGLFRFISLVPRFSLSLAILFHQPVRR